MDISRNTKAVLTAPDTTSAQRLLNKAAPYVLLLLAAMLSTLSFGRGVVYPDAQAELHIDPIGFLMRLTYAWTDQWALGVHTGSMHVYDTPYTWLYALLALLKTDPAIAQRIVMFAIYAWIAIAMYKALRRIVPGLSVIARIAGALVYLFDVYVIFNSAGTTTMLMSYAILPTVVGQLAGVLDGQASMWIASLITAVSFVFAGGINPPLLAIIVIVAMVYAIMRVLMSTQRTIVAFRLVRYAMCATAVTALVNIYWLWPFYDYIHSVWLGGILDESTAMHNEDSSFANVFRGFGQWGIFKGDQNGPWYPWAQWYVGGFFSWCLSAIPVIGFAAPLYKSGRRFATAFFFVTAAVSIPLVVGYYHGAIGQAITTPIYDFLYTRVPGFQMFRSVYKWVWPYEFAVAGLFAIAVDALREKLTSSPRLRSLAIGAVLALPVIAFMPAVINGTNPEMNRLPQWIADESSLVGNDQTQRVALFPGQYVEYYAWGNPVYDVDNATVSRPMVYGQLGSAPNQSSDEWLRRAYRYVRRGDPEAANFFRMLGVDTILQRDDFISVEDYAFPDEVTQTRATLAHDLVTRVLGARPSASDGPERKYLLAGALPMVYIARRAQLESAPIVATPHVIQPADILKGDVLIGSDGFDGRSIRQLRSNGVRGPANRDELAVTLLQRSAVMLNTQRSENFFTAPRSNAYETFLADASSLPGTPARKITIDGVTLREIAHYGAWTRFESRNLRAGAHRLTVTPVDFTRAALIVIAPHDVWQRTRLALKQFPAVPSIGHAPRAPLARSAFAYVVTGSKRQQTIGEVWRGRIAEHPDLPYVVINATPTVALDLPEQWYTLEDTYHWNRSVPVSLLISKRGMHFSVYSPYALPVRASFTGHLSAPLTEARFSVKVNGRRSAAFIVTSPPTHLFHTVRSKIFAGLHQVAPFSAPMTLQPGYNDVALVPLYTDTAAVPADVVRPKTVDGAQVALMPDIAFTVEHPVAERINSNVVTSAFRVGQSIPVPSDMTLAAVPHLTFSIDDNAASQTWLSFAFLVHSHVLYRSVALQPSAALPALADLLPDSYTDSDAKLLGVWTMCAGHNAPCKARMKGQFVTEEPLRRVVSSEGSVSLHQNPTIECQSTVCSAAFAIDVLRLPRSGDFVEFDLVAPGITHGSVTCGSNAVRSEWQNYDADGARLVVADRSLKCDGPLDLVVVWKRHRARTLPPKTDVAFWQPITRASAADPKTVSGLPLTMNSPVEFHVVIPARKFSSILVLNQSYHPEWRAELDGVSLRHLVANGYQNAWLVPALQNPAQMTIEFKGQRNYQIGNALSIFGALVAALITGFILYRQRRMT